MIDATKVRCATSISVFRSGDSAYDAEYRGHFYTRFLPMLVRAHLAYFPDFDLRITADRSVLWAAYGATLLNLSSDHPRVFVTVVDVEGPPLGVGMLWRMGPLFTGDYDAVITRDCDHLPSPREYAMVREWLESGRAAHAILDSTSHCGPLMGGTAGYRAGPLRARLSAAGVETFEQFIAACGQQADLRLHGSDQVALNRLVWPLLSGSAVVHHHPGIVTPHGDSGCEIAPNTNRPAASIGAGLFGRVDELLSANAAAKHVGAIFDIEKAERHFDAYAAAGVDFLVGESEAFAGDRRSVWQTAMAPLPRAVVGCNQNHDYSFFLPLTALAWRKAGVRLAAMCVGSPGSWGPHHSLAAMVARQCGAELYFVDEAGWPPSSNQAQIARLAAGLLPVHSASVLITSDLDLWPLARDFYRPHIESVASGEADACLWYANAYSHEPVPHFPLCHAAATAANWREMMGLGGASTLDGAVRELLGRIPPQTDGLALWCWDEFEFSGRLVAWEGGGRRVLRVDRVGGPPEGRIDRSNWPEKYDPRSLDAHLVRPGFGDVAWGRIRRLFAQFVDDSESMLAFLDAYRAQYVKLGEL